MRICRWVSCLGLGVLTANAIAGCSGSSSGNDNAGGSISVGGGGSPSSGGATISATGGSLGIGGGSQGGVLATGGGQATGGAQASAGTSSLGGSVATGGQSGGVSSTGGKSATGGAPSTGGKSATGGAPSTGGKSATGGAPSTGGASATGGSTGTAGSSATGVMTAANGQIYDATGQPFIPWGVNKCHVDQPNTGLELMNPNAVRVVLYFRLPNATTTNLMNRFVQNHIVMIPGRWGATCVGDGTFPSTLAADVDAWVAEAAAWKTYERVTMVNISNEAGPSNSTVWRDQYITAVQRMRAAGYAGLLMVDTGGCGQDVNDIVKYGPAVLAGDPLHNIVFSLHIYGNAQNRTSIDGMLDQIKATGLSAIVGEFGPGRNIGPSPTMITPQDVMGSAMAHGFGALAWAADDNNLANSMADDSGFCMLYNLGAAYTGLATQLTTFGKVVVNDPTVGLIAVAKKANGF